MLRGMKFFPILLVALAVFPAAAFADSVAVGDLTYDATSSSTDQFDITDLTGTAAFPPDAPITTPVSITVTSLVVNFSGGSSLTLPGSDFSVVDSSGDVNCTNSACNLFGDNIVSAVLNGTLSPTTGLTGLPAGDTGILTDFSTTITPDSVNCTGGTLLAGCDSAIIYATGVSGTTSATVSAPEPSTWALLGMGLLALAMARRKSWRRSAKASPMTA